MGDITVFKYILAGDRDIAVQVLQFLIDKGYKPEALIMPEKKSASSSGALIKLCPHLDKSRILWNPDFNNPDITQLIEGLDVNYIICIHFPHFIPLNIISIPKKGVINLHPAYLPYNRGWHTPTWTIIDGTPYGATLHHVNEKIDSGDIILQKELTVLPEDTAHTLYKRVLKLEMEVFKEAFPLLLSQSYKRIPQNQKKSTQHQKKDIHRIQELILSEHMSVQDVINRIRALTTNAISEAAYFKVKGKRYRIQAIINPDEEDE